MDFRMNNSSAHCMYFFAILCPGELNHKIQPFKLWMKEHYGTAAALKSPAHITMIQPFWLEETREENLAQTFQLFKSDMDELEIQLDGFSHFGKKVLFVKVKEDPALEELKHQAENHFLLSFSDRIKKDDRPFHPHVTIATRDLKPGDFDKAWLHFSEKIFKESFRARAISLLKLVDGKWKMIAEKKW